MLAYSNVSAGYGGVPVLKEITQGAQVREARVKLEIPHLAENGHLVPLTVERLML